MKCRKFTYEDQLAFAELSGDYNPSHIDAVATRRTIFGSPVVHGVHSLLWALDNWLQDKKVNVELCSIKANFNKPIKVGEEATCSLRREVERYVKIELLIGDSVVTNLEFNWARSSSYEADYFSLGYPERRECRILSASEVEKASGSLPLYLNIERSAKLFRYLCKRLSPLQIAQLLATTRLVGMGVSRITLNLYCA